LKDNFFGIVFFTLEISYRIYAFIGSFFGINNGAIIAIG